MSEVDNQKSLSAYMIKRRKVVYRMCYGRVMNLRQKAWWRVRSQRYSLNKRRGQVHLTRWHDTWSIYRTHPTMRRFLQKAWFQSEYQNWKRNQTERYG